MATEKRTLSKNLTIEAPKDKVWRSLLEEENFRRWTSVFMEGSYAETDWKEGSKARFLGPDGEGMVSRIAKHKPNEGIEIEHLGIVKGGKEDVDSEEAQKWKGKETYHVEEEGGKTRLDVNVDLPEDQFDWFSGKWDEALQKVKESAEA